VCENVGGVCVVCVVGAVRVTSLCEGPIRLGVFVSVHWRGF
jgi:hypothetical protein